MSSNISTFSTNRFAMELFLKICLCYLLLILPSNLYAQNNNINKKEEYIVINQDTTFTRNVTVTLKQNINASIYPIFYDIELEEVSNLKVYIKKGNRFKLYQNPIIQEKDLENEYINSKKIKSIVLPPNVEAKINYSVKCSELMYFSTLSFFSYDNIDTLLYKIAVPNTFHFAHNIVNKDSLDYLVIDSLQLTDTTLWKIEVIPTKVEPNILTYYGFYKNLRSPLMRTIVVPIAYQHKEKDYLNDWYIDIIEGQRGLDSTAISKIDELTLGLIDSFKIMDAIYSYVKNSFKYVGIEIGMGAFVPYHVNQVFVNKQGDCKDLSNFLSEALNYKGIKSSVALAATYNHISDCDFPSLGSANHLICVAYINDHPIILDPTDPIHLSKTPVQSLQDRSILIINSNGGEFYKINSSSPQQNEINYEIELLAESQKMLIQGTFKIYYKGISGNFLKRSFFDLSDANLNTAAKKYYESIFDKHTITNFKINLLDTIISVEGNLSVNGKIFTDKENQFIFVDFLPAIIEQEDRELMLEGTHLGSTIDKKVKLNITMDQPFQSFSPVEYSFSHKGTSLNFKIGNVSDLRIEYKYEFLNNHIIIDAENISGINDILKSFKKILNEPIILKSKN